LAGVSPNNQIDPKDLTAVLALINQKRAADGRPALEGFSKSAPDRRPAGGNAPEDPGKAEFDRLVAQKRAAMSFYLPSERARPEFVRQNVDNSAVGAAERATGMCKRAKKAARSAAGRSDWVRVLPFLAFASYGQKAGGAWRLWTLAKALDQAGSGVVVFEDLKNYVLEMGAGDKSFRRWLTDAKRRGWLHQVQRRDGSKVLILAGLVRVAGALGVSDPGGNWIKVRAKDLVVDGWRGFVWAGYLTTFKGPVSRERLEALTGVPQRTQALWEQTPGIEHEKNYAISGISGDHLTGFREHCRPASFEFRDRSTNEKNVIAWRLPDRRKVSSYTAELSNRGRLRKARRKLSSLEAASCSAGSGHSGGCSMAAARGQSTGVGAQRGLSGEFEFVRLYHDGYKGVKRELKRIGKLRRHDRLLGVREIYEHRRRGRDKPVRTWFVCGV
jgi:hypothetical protein